MPKISQKLKGGFSDIVNSTWNWFGGATEGAEFLRYFIDKDVKYTHLDIAGVVLDSTLNNKSN